MNTNLSIWVVLAILISTSFIHVQSAINEADTDEYLLVDEHNQHQIRIESYSWYFIAYDMVLVDKLVEEGMPITAAMKQSSYEDSIGKFEKNTVVNLTAQSKDVQHGFSINEVGVQLTLDRAQPGAEWGPLVTANFTTPDEDVTFTAFCHIYCGIGHPYEKINFIIGEGSPTYGNIVLVVLVLTNIAILVIMGTKIWKFDTIISEE